MTFVRSLNLSDRYSHPLKTEQSLRLSSSVLGWASYPLEGTGMKEELQGRG